MTDVIHANPVIRAIDAGHINHGDKCLGCSKGRPAKVEYPCPPILHARKAARARSDELVRIAERKRQLARSA